MYINNKTAWTYKIHLQAKKKEKGEGEGEEEGVSKRNHLQPYKFKILRT